MRRASHPLPRGKLDIEVDDGAGLVRLTFTHRGWLGLTHTQSVALRRATILVLALLATIVAVVGLGVLIGSIAAFAAMTALAVIEQTPSAAGFAPIAIDAHRRTVTVGDERFSLDSAQVQLTVGGWEMMDGRNAVFLGNGLGAPRATWLGEVLEHARAGTTDAIDLGPTVTPLPAMLDPQPATATFETDHEGIRAALPERSRGQVVGSAAQAMLLALWLVVYPPMFLGLDELALLSIVPGLIFAGAQLRRVIVTNRLRHGQVRIDRRYLHLREGRTSRRVALADIAHVHWGPAVMQVEMRDDTSFLLGNGWDLPSREILHDHLVDALKSALPPEETERSTPPVPDALARMLAARAAESSSR